MMRTAIPIVALTAGLIACPEQTLEPIELEKYRVEVSVAGGEGLDLGGIIVRFNDEDQRRTQADGTLRVGYLGAHKSPLDIEIMLPADLESPQPTKRTFTLEHDAGGQPAPIRFELLVTSKATAGTKYVVVVDTKCPGQRIQIDGTDVGETDQKGYFTRDLSRYAGQILNVSVAAQGRCERLACRIPLTAETTMLNIGGGCPGNPEVARSAEPVPQRSSEPIPERSAEPKPQPADEMREKVASLARPRAETDALTRGPAVRKSIRKASKRRARRKKARRARRRRRVREAPPVSPPAFDPVEEDPTFAEDTPASESARAPEESTFREDTELRQVLNDIAPPPPSTGDTALAVADDEDESFSEPPSSIDETSFTEVDAEEPGREDDGEDAPVFAARPRGSGSDDSVRPAATSGTDFEAVDEPAETPLFEETEEPTGPADAEGQDESHGAENGSQSNGASPPSDETASFALKGRAPAESSELLDDTSPDAPAAAVSSREASRPPGSRAVEVSCDPRGLDLFVDGALSVPGCAAASTAWIRPGVRKLVLKNPPGVRRCPKGRPQFVEIPRGGRTTPKISVKTSCSESCTESVRAALKQGLPAADKLACLADIGPRDDDFLDARLLRAHAHLMNSELADAEQVLAAVVKTRRGRTDPEARARLAEVFGRRKRLEEASREAEKAWRYRMKFRGNRNQRETWILSVLKLRAGFFEQLFYRDRDRNYFERAVQTYETLEASARNANKPQLLRVAQASRARLQDQEAQLLGE